MIVTVTLNAALDRTLTVPGFQIGYRHRSSDVLAIAGGKGINVARALKLLEVPVVATGLAGGRTGTRIVEELTAEAILNDFVRIAHESRTSSAVVDPTSGTYTEINEWGPEVTAAELDLLGEKLHYLARGADFVVLAGSLPRRVPTSFYADVIRNLARRDVRVVLDSEGEALRAGVEAGPVPRLAEPERGRGAGRAGARGRRRLPDGARRDRRDGPAQRRDHPRERVLRTPSDRPQAAPRAGARDARRAGLARRLGRRPPRAVPRRDRRGALPRRRDPPGRGGRCRRPCARSARVVSIRSSPRRSPTASRWPSSSPPAPRSASKTSPPVPRLTPLAVVC